MYPSTAYEDDRLFVSVNHVLYAFNAKNGTQLWAFTPPNILDDDTTLLTQPVVSAGVVYISQDDTATRINTPDNPLYALDVATGQVLLSINRPHCITDYLGVGVPAVSNNTAYIPLEAYRSSMRVRSPSLQAVDLTTKKPLWTFWSQSRVIAPALVNNVLYFATACVTPHECAQKFAETKLYALNATTGEELWSTPIVTARMGSSPVLVYNDKVYLDTYDGDHRGLARIGFTEFDARTGNLMGRDEYGLFFRNCSACDCFDENPVVANGIMYFVANNNIDYNKTRLHAVDPATAEILRSFDATGSPLAQPTVVNGTIYFGCDDGSVYALEPVSN